MRTAGGHHALIAPVGRAMALAAAAGLLGCTGVIDSPGPVAALSEEKPKMASACAANRVDVSPTPMRRLTRQEYAAAVRDLLGLSSVPVDQIPTDEKVGPFYSNPVSAITDLWTEQYMHSA